MPRTIKRRRKENKTDYLKRLKLLKSGKTRIVFRKTNKYIIAQYVESQEAQDKIVFTLNSKDLMKFGWPKEMLGSLKSLPASYLLGILTGKKIQEMKLQNPIIDFGMIRNLHKTKIYAFQKGLIDSGLEIKFNKEKEIFPSEEKINGKTLKKDFSKDIEKIKNNLTK
jgi:large subunit ribosomal protein L18